MPARITALIDRSGSMKDLHSATIHYYNEWLRNLQMQPGEASIRLIEFDTEYSIVYDSPLNKARTLTINDMVPRGGTAFNDALGRTINELGSELSSLSPEERPSSITVYIQTDGKENSSKEFTLDQCNAMVTHQREKYNWQFYLAGANMDAQRVAEAYGMDAKQAITYAANRAGIGSVMRAAANAVNFTRARGVTGQSVNYSFTQEERNAALLDVDDPGSALAQNIASGQIGSSTLQNKLEKAPVLP